MFNTIESPAKRLAKCSKVDVITKVSASFFFLFCFLKKKKNPSNPSKPLYLSETSHTPQTPTSGFELTQRHFEKELRSLYFILGKVSVCTSKSK